MIFYGALQFEGAQSSRSFILTTIFLGFLSLGIVRLFFSTRGRLFTISFLIDVAFVFLLEYNSKYLINYFFHSFYIFILLEASLVLSRKNSLWVGVTAILASLTKYLMLIYYKSNLASISEMIFFIAIGALILVIINFSLYYKEEKEKKDDLYKELLQAHKKLKEYTDKIEELTIMEERNRIARDIHDTLGHNMTATIMEIEMAYHLLDEDILKAKSILDRCKKSSRKNLIQIREVVETLKVTDNISKGIESIKNLTEEFSTRTGIDIVLSIIGATKELNPSIATTLYRIIQEALTNAVRHGEATKIHIELDYKEKEVHFTIENNGKCNSSIVDGYGIKGMKERVNNLMGEVEVISGSSFIVKGFLPLEVKKND